MDYGRWVLVLCRNMLSSTQKMETVWNTGTNLPTTWCNKPEGHNIKARVYTSSDITSNVGGNIWGQQQTLN